MVMECKQNDYLYNKIIIKNVKYWVSEEFTVNQNIVFPYNKLKYYLSIYETQCLISGAVNTNVMDELNWMDETTLDGMFTFDQLMEVISWYYQYSGVECIRYSSALMFYLYHHQKYCHFIDYQSYIKFWANVFYDPSVRVSTLFQVIQSIGPKCTSHKHYDYNYDVLISYIVRDNRFNKWFLYNYNESVKYLESMMDKLNFSVRGSKSNKVQLVSIKDIKNALDLDPNCNNIPVNISSIFFKQEQLDSGRIINKSNNSNIVFHYNNRKFSNVILNRIIEFIIVQYTNSKRKIHELPWIYNKPYTSNQSEILSLSLVSKNFFSTCSNIISGIGYYWYSPFNLDSQYCLVREPPIYFNYSSIKGIPYSSNKSVVDHYFSRVETCVVICEDGKRHCIDSYHGLNINYLVYPPPMPSMKKLKVLNFKGEYNNLKLLLYIIMSSVNNTSSCNNSISNSNGESGSSLEYVVLKCCFYSISKITSILSTLNKYCSKSLKKVKLEIESHIGVSNLENRIDLSGLDHIQSIIFINGNRYMGYSGSQ